MVERNTKTLCLFDVDGTLTAPRKIITKETFEFLQRLKKKTAIAVVGGSDLSKIQEQLSQPGFEVITFFDYVFAENGLMAYKNGIEIGRTSISKHLGEAALQKIINFLLHYIADLQIPIKRGTFIEFRNGMINCSPIGRNCSQQERDEFEIYDKKHNIRSTMVNTLKHQFQDMNLCFSIGGQISIDIFPKGWDKTYCLKYLHNEGFTAIHFFGDKTTQGGNDYEIYTSDQVVGHSVKNPQDTVQQLEQLFFS